uniref:Uncharacterized protein n=1 Tax=Heterorhabditis bacteriophora TaxID=37862 RepID=A0A1I7XJ65_HETBA
MASVKSWDEISQEELRLIVDFSICVIIKKLFLATTVIHLILIRYGNLIFYYIILLFQVTNRIVNIFQNITMLFSALHNNSRSTLVDSGYDKSHLEDMKDLRKVVNSPDCDWKIADELDKQTEKELKSLVE